MGIILPDKDLKKIPVHFILSKARTGSTLLSAMLNMHPEILSVSEEPFAFNLYDGYKNISVWNDEIIERFIEDFFLFSEGALAPQFSSREQMKKIFSENKEGMNFQKAVRLAYFSFLPDKVKSGVRMIVDKELIFHTQIKKVAKIYPDAKFIILLRDPRDNVLVRIKQVENMKIPYNIYFLTIGWKEIFARLVSFAKNDKSGRFIYVYYEQLVSNPVSELKKITDFLGVSYTGEMLNYDTAVKKNIEKNASNLSENVLKNIAVLHDGLTKKTYTDKIGFWKKEMDPALADFVWTVNRELAMQLGYEEDGSFSRSDIGLKYFYFYFKFIVTRIWIAKVYYLFPFFIRRMIKKIKYRRQYKTSHYTEKEFLKEKVK